MTATKDGFGQAPFRSRPRSSSTLRPGAFARIAGRSAALRQDVSVDLDDPAALKKLLLKNPIAAWTGRKDPSGRAYFVLEGDTLRTGPALKSPHRDALCDLVAELVEWRLARYLQARTKGTRFKVLRNASGRPILKIDRRKDDLPEDWVDVAIDGEAYEVKFAKEFVNVVRRKGDEQEGNVLPEVMYRWFGEDAGRRGTAFGVSHAAEEGGGYVWTPVRGGNVAEGRAIVGDDGKAIDARYELESAGEAGDSAAVVLMSRGGGRNDEYTLGMRLVLERMAAAALVVQRIEVASGEMEGRPLDERLVRIAGREYPLRLVDVQDVEKLRKAIGKGIAAVGRKPGAKGSGNANKRVRIVVEGVTVAELGRVIAGTRG